MLNSKLLLFCIAALTNSILSASTLAAAIAVNFSGYINADGTPARTGRFNPGDTDNGNLVALPAAEIAGVVPSANWNNAASVFSNGGLPDGQSGTMGTLDALTSDDGTATTANISWIGAGMDTAQNAPEGSNGTTILGNAHLASVTVAGRPASLTIEATNLPFVGAYDVYVYYGSFQHDQPGQITLGASTFDVATSPWTDANAGLWTAGTATAEDGVADDGQYVLFSGVTGTSFTITAQHLETRFGINGFQMVGVIPEPTSIGLLSVGTLGLLVRRFRRV